MYDERRVLYSEIEKPAEKAVPAKAAAKKA
jgi:hypothetical protein